MACVRRGRRYKATTINEALAPSITIIEDTSGLHTGSYRVVHRMEAVVLPETAYLNTRACELLNATMDNLLAACEALGYTNLERDALRIVDGVDSKTLKKIPNSPPIIIIPFWDNCMFARYAIPSADGNACMLRLAGIYENPFDSSGYMYAVNRSVRAAKTQEWLGHAGGIWRNGWSDLNSSDGISVRRFDTFGGRELHYKKQKDCPESVMNHRWGSSLISTTTSLGTDAVVASNDSRFGLFLLRAEEVHSVKNAYDFTSFLSNVSTAMLFLRWMMAMLAFQNGYRSGKTSWYNCGIGCIAYSSTLNSLPFTLFPQLKMTLAAFFTAGCTFFGEQQALIDAWFVIYPALIEIVLFCCSLLNILARVFRRRMSDCMILPTITLLGMLHYFRLEISTWRWFQADGITASVMTSNEFDALTVLDFFTGDAAVRMNGHTASLLRAKLFILSFNVLPLLFSKSMARGS